MNIQVFAHLENGPGTIPFQTHGHTVSAHGRSCSFTDVLKHTEVNSNVMYNSAVMPLVESFAAGYDVALVLCGDNHSHESKRHMLSGDTPHMDANVGVVGRVVDELLTGRYSTGGASTTILTMRSWDIQNEVVTDLNNPESIEPQVVMEVEYGDVVYGLKSMDVTSGVQCTAALRKAMGHIPARDTKLGCSNTRSTSAVVVQRIVTGVRNEASRWNTFTFLNLASADALAEDPLHVEMAGGPNVNKSMLAMADMVALLAGNPKGAARVDYNRSKITRLTKNIFGGNCQTAMVAMLTAKTTGKVAEKVLEFCHNVADVTNYPIVCTNAARGLEMRYRAMLAAERPALYRNPDVDGGNGMEALGALKLDEMHGKLVTSDLESRKLHAEIRRLQTSLAEAREDYNKVLTEKAIMGKDVLTNEDQRLEFQKAMLDMRIQNARIQDESETLNFANVNKVLTLERELEKLREKLRDYDDDKGAIGKTLEDTEADYKDLNEEYTQLKASHSALRNRYDGLHVKNAELHREVIALAQSKLSFLKATDAMTPAVQAEITSTERQIQEMEGDVADKDSVIRTRLQQLHEENERLQQVSIATAAAPLTSSTPRVTTSAASHASGDRNSSNDDELLQARLAAAAAERHLAQSQRQENITRNQLDVLQESYNQLSARHDTQVELYRSRLTKYINDIGDFTAGTQGAYVRGMDSQLKRYIEAMFKDIQDTYTRREQELLDSLERRVAAIDALEAREKEVLTAYTTCCDVMHRKGLTVPPTATLTLNGGGDLAPATPSTTGTYAVGRPSHALHHSSRLSRDVTAHNNQSHATMDDQMWRDMQQMVREFTSTTQRTLEKERADLLLRCVAAEEKSRKLEEYISTNLSKYQNEIVRLRKAFVQGPLV